MSQLEPECMVLKKFADIFSPGVVLQVILLVISIFVNVISKSFTKHGIESKFHEHRRRQENAESIEDLMKQYKKPLIQSAFELQSRLQQQVTRNLMYLFSTQGEERKLYALYSTMYLFCEFLGWLEIVRREVVFITGQKAETLNQLLDDIKFQFTGETIIQGTKIPANEGADVHQEDWATMQILNVELRAIGEAMIKHRTYDDQNPNQTNTALEVIGYTEFVCRLMEALPEPSSDSAATSTAEIDSKIKIFKVAIKPLYKSVQRLLNKDAPKERMTMMQVLLCKLIDVLDDGGQGFDHVHAQFLSRNHRITPVVANLTPPALKWLADRPYMEDCKATLTKEHYKKWCELVGNDDNPIKWLSEINENMEMYSAIEKLSVHDQKYCKPLTTKDLAKLAFPGFRADIQKFSEAKAELGPAWFPGAFPPRRPRITWSQQQVSRCYDWIMSRGNNKQTDGVNDKKNA